MEHQPCPVPSHTTMPTLHGWHNTNKKKHNKKDKTPLCSGLDHFLCTLQYTPHFMQTTTHWELLVHDTQAVDIDWVQTEELQTLSTWMWVEEPTYFRQRAGRRNVTDLGARWLLCTPHWISQTPFSTFGSFNAGWTKKSDKIISCLHFLLQAVAPQRPRFYRPVDMDVPHPFSFSTFIIQWYFLLFSCSIALIYVWAKGRKFYGWRQVWGTMWLWQYMRGVPMPQF